MPKKSMEAVKIISQIKNAIWGTPTLVLLMVFGIYFTARSRFFLPKSVLKTVKDTLGSLKPKKDEGISPFAALATALGGTVGIGSIVGIGHALEVGGAGSIFWMWVCSFFGMGLKYAEVRIALNKRIKTPKGLFGGAPFRLGEMGYKKTAIAFCIFCIAVSFSTGNLTQTGVMFDFFQWVNLSKPLAVAICFFVVAVALFGGRKRIAKINSVIVPLASAVYLICALIIIILNRRNLGMALGKIFEGAFGFSAMVGGFSGAMLSHVIREGFARSLFSNEAGMGSSPLAHATGNGNIAVQAEWGIFEIFFDTFLVSTITALCLLSANTTNVADMFATIFPRFGLYLFGILGAVFAFASVISWCYYGECCIVYMFPKGKKSDKIYRFAFALVTLLGAVISKGTLWEIADILNALMMFPNLFLLFKCRKEIERIV